MSPAPNTPVGVRLWRGIYGVLLTLLPRMLRHRHGQHMLDLVERDLLRSAQDGRLSLHAAGVAAIFDLVRRGLVERVAEERRALAGGEWLVLRTSTSAFLFAAFVLTDVLVALSVRTRLPRVSGDQAVEMVLYSVPFNAALAVPMAMFIAVLWAANRPAPERGAERSANGPRRTPSLRLVPVVLFATGVALLSYVMNAEVVPRANAKLEVLEVRNIANRSEWPLSDRSMTMNELRTRSRGIARASGANATSRTRESLANLNVEIHKKFALSAACLALALLAAGIAHRAPRAGVLLQSFASVVVFSGYYMLLMGGESLADQLIISPALAMWSANLAALALAAAALRNRGSGYNAERPETMRSPVGTSC